jgi:hypothetical protein
MKEEFINEDKRYQYANLKLAPYIIANCIAKLALKNKHMLLIKDQSPLQHILDEGQLKENKSRRKKALSSSFLQKRRQSIMKSPKLRSHYWPRQTAALHLS